MKKQLPVIFILSVIMFSCNNASKHVDDATTTAQPDSTVASNRSPASEPAYEIDSSKAVASEPEPAPHPEYKLPEQHIEKAHNAHYEMHHNNILPPPTNIAINDSTEIASPAAITDTVASFNQQGNQPANNQNEPTKTARLAYLYDIPCNIPTPSKILL